MVLATEEERQKARNDIERIVKKAMKTKKVKPRIKKV